MSRIGDHDQSISPLCLSGDSHPVSAPEETNYWNHLWSLVTAKMAGCENTEGKPHFAEAGTRAGDHGLARGRTMTIESRQRQAEDRELRNSCLAALENPEMEVVKVLLAQINSLLKLRHISYTWINPSTNGYQRPKSARPQRSSSRK